ncbi:hypothetical protein KUCAC02_026084, partial [Chaenocephalus aceratus]
WTLASPAASHIWSETELSKQRWVVWDISRELQAGQDCATQTFLQSKAGLEVYKVIVLDTDCVNETSGYGPGTGQYQSLNKQCSGPSSVDGIVIWEVRGIIRKHLASSVWVLGNIQVQIDTASLHAAPHSGPIWDILSEVEIKGMKRQCGEEHSPQLNRCSPK